MKDDNHWFQLTDSPLNTNYWQQRYIQDTAGWDTGGITPPIQHYMDGVRNKSVRILIPGCGNAHEASYLHQQGFTQVYVCDWASSPLEALAKRCPDFPKEHLIQGDFFDLALQDLDYIVEQTFFCAIEPKLRPKYAQKTASMLQTGGQLIGLLFNKNLPAPPMGPPFKGSKEEYLGYFQPHFSSVQIEPCYNSIQPRSGLELFIQLQK
ncbi:MAG: methyltransferase domain-containing protein [Aureispira sp.]